MNYSPGAAWSSDGLLSKAVRYAAVMLEQDRDSWLYPFWSSLTLEILARAALASVTPALLAESENWTNTYYALVGDPPGKKYIPKSINIADVFGRLGTIFPEFNKELATFASAHVARRNSEVHSAELAFDGLKTADWLPMFYSCCSALLTIMEEDLSLLFGEAEAAAAAEMIAGLKDEAAKQVGQAINAHRTVWEGRSDEARGRRAAEAELWATSLRGHRVVCPACSTVALVTGDAVGSASRKLEDGDVVVERYPMLPSHFQCMACELQISGYARLAACGLGSMFTATARYDAADLFAPEEEEPDFNEY